MFEASLAGEISYGQNMVSKNIFISNLLEPPAPLAKLAPSPIQPYSITHYTSNCAQHPPTIMIPKKITRVARDDLRPSQLKIYYASQLYNQIHNKSNR